MGNTIGTVSWNKSEHDDVTICILLQALRETYELSEPNHQFMEYDGDAKSYFGVEKRIFWTNNDNVKAFLHDAETMLMAHNMQGIKTYFTHVHM